MKAPRFARAIVVAIAAATTLTACGGSAASVPKEGEALTTVQIGRAPAFPQFPLFVAEEKGFWQAGGIKAEFVGVGSGPEQTAAQVSGALDIVDNVPNNLLPVIDKGVELKAFTVSTKASQFDIIVSKNYPLTAKQGDWKAVMQELKGANVGVIARGTGAEDIARTLFKEAGVDPDAQTYIGTGLPPTTIAAMQNNQIDMAITIEPGITQAVKAGLAVAPFSIRAGEAPENLKWPGVVGTVTKKFAAENPDALKRYIAVMETTLAWIRDPANKDETIALLKKSLSVPDEAAGGLYEKGLENYAEHVALTDADIAALGTAATWVKGLGKITKEYKGQDFTVKVG